MKQYIAVAFLFLLISAIGASLFYWYQIRPAQIRHDCSWVKKHSAAVPARAAMTIAQLITKGIIRSCQKEINTLKKVNPEANYTLGDMSVYRTLTRWNDGRIHRMSHDPLWEATSCIEDGNKIIADYKSTRKPVPAKDWYEQAEEDEYKFCLHDKGL